MKEEKRRLMYIQSEDFYFLTYNTFILLKTLDCTNGKRYLKDYRKISFLMDFISNPYLCSFLSKDKLSVSDTRELTKIYSNGIIRLKELNKLFYTLDNQGFISLERNDNSDILNITLNDSKLPEDYFNGELFKVELNNAVLIKTNIKRLTSITLDSFKEKLFTTKGVKAWELF